MLSEDLQPAFLARNHSYLVVVENIISQQFAISYDVAKQQRW